MAPVYNLDRDDPSCTMVADDCAVIMMLAGLASHCHFSFLDFLFLFLNTTVCRITTALHASACIAHVRASHANNAVRHRNSVLVSQSPALRARSRPPRMLHGSISYQMGISWIWSISEICQWRKYFS